MPPIGLVIEPAFELCELYKIKNIFCQKKKPGCFHPELLPPVHLLGRCGFGFNGEAAVIEAQEGECFRPILAEGRVGHRKPHQKKGENHPETSVTHNSSPGSFNFARILTLSVLNVNEAYDRTYGASCVFFRGR